VRFTFSMFFSASGHIPFPLVCLSNFYVFQFSGHIPGPKVYVFHYPRFSVFLAIFHFL